MDQCPVNKDLMIRLINEQSPRKPITGLQFPRPLKSGFSGSSVWLAHISEMDRFRFGVLKIPGLNKDRDVELDGSGYELMRTCWPAEILPKESSGLLQHPELVKNRTETPVLLLSFADEISTENPRPLTELVDSSVGLAQRCLTRLVETYAERMTATVRCFRTGEAPLNFNTGSLVEHMREILHPDLMAHIKAFDWNHFGIDANDAAYSVNLTRRPNPLYALDHPDLWKEDNIELPRVPIHGDLNLDNIIAVDADSFVLIDFEKARTGLPLYDLAFLFMWLIKRVRLQHVSMEIEEEGDALADLAEKLACAVGDDGKNGLDAIGHKDLAVALFAETMLFPMHKMVDPCLLPEEFQRKGARLALAMAALARSFYELRAALSPKSAQPELHELFGFFSERP